MILGTSSRMLVLTTSATTSDFSVILSSQQSRAAFSYGIYVGDPWQSLRRGRETPAHATIPGPVINFMPVAAWLRETPR
jgi:hypothetical protein